MRTKLISIEQNCSLNVAINYKEEGHREQSININTDLDGVGRGVFTLSSSTNMEDVPISVIPVLREALATLEHTATKLLDDVE